MPGDRDCQFTQLQEKDHDDTTILILYRVVVVV